MGCNQQDCCRLPCRKRSRQSRRCGVLACDPRSWAAARRRRTRSRWRCTSAAASASCCRATRRPAAGCPRPSWPAACPCSWGRRSTPCRSCTRRARRRPPRRAKAGCDGPRAAAGPPQPRPRRCMEPRLAVLKSCRLPCCACPAQYTDNCCLARHPPLICHVALTPVMHVYQGTFLPARSLPVLSKRPAGPSAPACKGAVRNHQGCVCKAGS
jgi:hypothetical protein